MVEWLRRTKLLFFSSRKCCCLLFQYIQDLKIYQWLHFTTCLFTSGSTKCLIVGPQCYLWEQLTRNFVHCYFLWGWMKIEGLRALLLCWSWNYHFQNSGILHDWKEWVELLLKPQKRREGRGGFFVGIWNCGGIDSYNC